MAQIVSVYEFLEQFQIDMQDLSQTFSETLDKANLEKENTLDTLISEGGRSDIDRCENGREKEQELSQENLKIHNNLDSEFYQNLDSYLNEIKINRKKLYLNKNWP